MARAGAGIARGRALRGSVLAALLVPSIPWLGLAEAHAQSASPSPSPMVSLTGSIGGSLSKGHELVVHVSAVDRAGWRSLDRLEITLVVNGTETDRIVYELENQSLALGTESLVVGTGDEASGTHLRVSGSKVFVTTGGPRLELTVTADVLRTIPADARFQLTASDFSDNVASVTRSFVAAKAASGLTWGSVLAYVVLALLAGGFVGNLFASKRRRPRLSVDGTIQRRIVQDPTRPGKRSA
jgi:hypothetical protein